MALFRHDNPVIVKVTMLTCYLAHVAKEGAVSLPEYNGELKNNDIKTEECDPLSNRLH